MVKFQQYNTLRKLEKAIDANRVMALLDYNGWVQISPTTGNHATAYNS